MISERAEQFFSERCRCSICEKHFCENDSEWLPFCSARCKQIDAMRWLNEFYTLPIEQEESYNPDTEGEK